VEALREGAWDFVVKPIEDMAVLEHAIEGALEKARLIRDNNRYQRELEQANRTLREQLARIEEDADAGRRIQLQLMPPREQVFGEYGFVRLLLPSMFLSGDFVDYFYIGHDHIGFFLADVSGHGVSSAFVTVLIKSFVRSALERLHEDGERAVLHPVRMLEELNQDLLRQRLDKYLTIFYAVIDRGTGRLSYCSAAHFPSPMLVDGGATRFLPGRGMPIGLFPEPMLESTELDLPRSCALVLCSDGVLETLAGSSLNERLGHLLAAVDGVGVTPEGVLARLGIDPGRAYLDDITFLILSREARP
jgi:serine phosphatase RsbU (regulator of sigma subunit)